MKPDQQRVHALLVDTVTLLCKNGLNFQKGIKLEGVLGITVDDSDVFIVHINEFLQNEACNAAAFGREKKPSAESVAVPLSSEITTSLPRKRRRNRSQSSQEDRKVVEDTNPDLNVDRSALLESDQQDASCMYLIPDSQNSTSCTEETVKKETAEDSEVIFVKREEGGDFDETFGSYGKQTSDSDVSRNYDLCLPIAGVVESQSKIPVDLQPLDPKKAPAMSLQLTYSGSNSFPASSSNLALKDEEENGDEDEEEGSIPTGQEEFLSYSHWGSSLYVTQGLDSSSSAMATKRRHSWERQKSSGPRNDIDASLHEMLPKRKGSDGMWQVVSRFVCNFPECTLSFSTKQNLLRHQTQKHGRQKSRIVGQARRFVEQLANYVS